MNIPPKYEDVVAELSAALDRESEMVARANQNKLMMDAACGEIATLKEELVGFELVQQRLTVAERRTDSLEALLYMSKELITTMSRGGLKPSDWCDSFKSEVADRIEKIGAALKPAEEGEGS